MASSLTGLCFIARKCTQGSEPSDPTELEKSGAVSKCWALSASVRRHLRSRFKTEETKPRNPENKRRREGRNEKQKAGWSLLGGGPRPHAVLPRHEVFRLSPLIRSSVSMGSKDLTSLLWQTMWSSSSPEIDVEVLQQHSTIKKTSARCDSEIKNWHGCRWAEKFLRSGTKQLEES